MLHFDTSKYLRASLMPRESATPTPIPFAAVESAAGSMMKVQCDVCAVKAASIFCCADEAALCGACDLHVHRANKLAGKHRRFSLIHAEPSSSSSAQKQPFCDVCQERKGLLFCKEERKILCRECDVPLHTASEMMRRHSRFLLTGVRLSSAPVESPVVPEEKVEAENSSSPRIADSLSGGAGATTASASEGSSISEYLTKTLPGWHVEDFLVDDADVVGTAACSDGLDQGGQVQVGGLLEEVWPACPVGEQGMSDVSVTGDERASRERWVPQVQKHTDWTESKRPRASLPCSYR